MRSIRFFAPLFSALFVFGCNHVVESDGDIVTAEQAILGGSATTQYPEAACITMIDAEGESGCSGTLIAPSVVLTAGHCVDGFSDFEVQVGAETRIATSSAVFDWASNASGSVDPALHDIGLLFLDQPITLDAYPSLATAELASPGAVVHVGCVGSGGNAGDVYAVSGSVDNGASLGYGNAYQSALVIENGDSGGASFAAGTHTVAAVSSGIGSNAQVLARVDLLQAWISAQVASHGGAGAAYVNDPAPNYVTNSLEGNETATNLTEIPLPIDILIEAETNPYTTTFMKSDEWAIAEGDIVFGSYTDLAPSTSSSLKASPKGGGSTSSAKAGTTPTNLVGVTDRRNLWPKSSDGKVYVPYIFDPTVPTSMKAAVQSAAAHIQQRSCVRFVPRVNEADYVQITKGQGCYSQIGKLNGKQTLSLGTGCDTMGTALHEMMHTLGFWHEHSRPDRDNYITVNLARVAAGGAINFTKLGTNIARTLGDYDFGSIMHYSSYAFTVNGLPTITAISPSNASMGQRLALSTKDVAGLEALYACP